VATQRFTVAKIGGAAGPVVADLFRRWREPPESAPAPEIAAFVRGLRANGHTPPVVSFAEWTDYWLMGDALSDLMKRVRGVVIAASHFEAALCDQPETLARLPRDGWQFGEERVLVGRLHEAADAWEPLVQSGVVVIVREVLGPTVLDEEMTAALATVPAWLRP
jgi:hypothetical protein